MRIVGTGVAKASPNTNLRIIVANMGNTAKTPTIGRTISGRMDHPTDMNGEPITYGEVLGVAVEKMYWKRPCDAKAEDVINRALEKNRKNVF